MAAHRIRAYVGLGANVGDAPSTLLSAIEALDALPQARVRDVSRLYRTRPVGVEDQPDFRNAVVALDVSSTRDDPNDAALDLLVELKRLERGFGRRRRRHWGPRELDLDLLVFGRHRVAMERPPEGRSVDPVKAADGGLLVVPHPEAAERLFVLAPLADLAPRLVPPGWGETVATVRDRRAAAEGPDAVRLAGTWDASARRWGPGRRAAD